MNDPEADVWIRFEAMLERHAPQLLKTLQPPASIEQVQAAERAIGVTFPADLRKAYLRHNGTLTGYSLAPVRENSNNKLFEPFNWWASLDELVSESMWVNEMHERMRLEVPDLYPEAQSFWEELRVKPVGGSEKWIPIGLSGTATRVYVDMDPAGQGVVGQIIKDDYMGEPSWRADGLDAYLQSLIDRMECGELVYEDGWQVVSRSMQPR